GQMHRRTPLGQVDSNSSGQSGFTNPAFAVLWLVECPASAKRTYGYYRAEILAAMLNGASLGGHCDLYLC
ncbi:MAG: hypothetical protein CVV27_18290, partial [Candidatus Melainabacteria bacterium HGW-Melainabacteria-1]